MKFIALISFVVVTVSGSVLLDQAQSKAFGFLKSISDAIAEQDYSHRKSPDEHIKYEKFKMRGIYSILLRPMPKLREEGIVDQIGYLDDSFVMDNDDDDDDDDDIEETQVETSLQFEFVKYYDAHQKVFRLDAHPIGAPWENIQSSDKHHHNNMYLGPFTVWVHENDAYMITLRDCEHEQDENTHMNDVQCHKVPRAKFRQHKSPIKDATYDGLTFAEDRLCHRYVDLKWDMRGDGGIKCKLDNSELNIDAFTHEPVELFLDGSVKKREHEHGYHFTINVDVIDFDFEIEDEKEVFKMPHTVRELCMDAEEHEDMENQVSVIELMMLDGVM